MDRDQIEKLIERLEQGSGPDRELDAEIAAAVGWDPLGAPDFWVRWEERVAIGRRVYLVHSNGERGASVLSPKLTASIDAVVALADRLFPGINWDVSWTGGEWRPGYIARARVAMPYSGRGDKEDGLPCEKGEAKTTCRAILSALLHAVLSTLEAK